MCSPSRSATKRGTLTHRRIADTERQTNQANSTNHELTFDPPQTVQDVLGHQCGMYSRITS
jgi:hypothetical protein